MAASEGDNVLGSRPARSERQVGAGAEEIGPVAPEGQRGGNGVELDPAIGSGSQQFFRQCLRPAFGPLRAQLSQQRHPALEVYRSPVVRID